MEDFVSRNLARASTTGRAQSRRKQLEKIERIDKPQGNERSAFFSFIPERESGNVVLQASDLDIGYSPERSLSQGINLDIRKGDAIALIGPNGIGKSTLLKTLVGQIEPNNGEIKYGTKVDVGYYDQEQKNLSSSKTVLNEVWDEHPLMTEESVRTFLGSFLFTGEDVEKSISSLSGGERARVSLAKLALNGDNFLVLDEPTNHLDIDSKEVLENALIDFHGALLFVSHDRYFINRLASKVLEIGPDGTVLYLGDYDYYLHKKEEMKHLKKAAERENKATSDAKTEPESSQNGANSVDQSTRKDIKRQTRKLTREIDDLEKQIAVFEQELEEITNQMNKLSSSSESSNSGFSEETTKKLMELSSSYDEKNAELEELLIKWEETQEELEEYL